MIRRKLAGKARSQFRTGLDCHRFFPDPPGNVFAVNLTESFLFVAKCAPEGVRGGWCSAQRIRILMIAGGNHTTIHRLWRAYGTTFSASPVGFFASFLAETRKEGPRQGSGSTRSMKNGKGNSAFGNERRRTSPHWAVLSFWCLLPDPPFH